MAAEIKKKRLGEILIEQGVLKQGDLEKALELQKKEGGLLGSVLIRHGFVQEEDIVVALATQFNYPYLPVENFAINPDVIKLISSELIKKYYLMPIDRISNVLTVIMADPSNEEAIKEIEKVSGCKVQAFVGTVSEIQNAIKRVFKDVHFEEGLSGSEGVANISFKAATEKKKENQELKTKADQTSNPMRKK